VITPTFDSSITSDPNAAAIEGVINSAISTYENLFTNPITVLIQFQEMSSGLGSSTTGFVNMAYTSYLNAFNASAVNPNQATALAILNADSGLPNNPVNGNANINVKTADGRAVGLNTPGFVNGNLDGVIGLNTHITDVGSPGTTGQYSLFATVQHEIDEVLGLGSALPSIPFSTIFPEDLYRYASKGIRSFTTDPSAQAFFSFDGGNTLLAQFDNQNDGGDYGDWQSNPLPPGVNPQVQDAFATVGAHPTLGPNEIDALNVIGYNLHASVPEPSTAAIAGLSGILALAYGCVRRRS
jgi:hypothetical protein